jgi:NTE family protein
MLSYLRGPALALLCLFLFVCYAPAQDTTPPHARPKIGLALSGGGARGLAHIGVLQWMEENHIPADYIAGTSMGGLIGAMYATGMSPDEMGQFVEHIDWDETLLSEPSYAELSVRRKEDRRAYQIGAPLGLKHGLSGPNGFNPGHGVALLFDRVAYPYSPVGSFDELPIPFRCVATNMLDGTAVVLSSGSLGQALRATMAIPGIFTPVEIDGKILADGGLVENIPSRVAREMKADIVIAVDVGTPLGGREQLRSIGGVLTQTISVMTIDNDRRALREADLVIAPDLGKYTNVDYYNAAELIRLGYEGAAHKAAVLRPFAVSDAQWQQYLQRREARKRKPQATIDLLEISGVDDSDRRRLEKNLKGLLHQPVNSQKLDSRLTEITGQGRFDSLGYEGFTRDGKSGLRIIGHEKTYGPPFVDLAVDVNGTGVGNTNFSAGMRVTFMDVRGHGGEWRNDLTLGAVARAATEFYQPIKSSRFFVAPYAFATKVARNAYADGDRIALFRDRRAGGGLDVGFTPNDRSEIRAGYQLYNGDLAALIGETGLPRSRGTSGLFRVRFTFDGQDSPVVPSRGVRLEANLSHVLQSPGTTQSIDQLEVQSSSFFPLSAKGSLFTGASFGTTFSRDAGPFQVFTLGGPFRLGAYLPDEFLGNHYGYLSLGYRRELFRLPAPLGKKVYWGGWYEAGSAFDDPSSFTVRGSMNLGMITETILGPISLAGSVSPSGKTRINFSIGRIF